MTMRHVDIDDKLLKEVMNYFGARKISTAINAALAHIAANPEHCAEVDRRTDPVAALRTETYMKRPHRGPGFWSTTAQ